MLLGHEKWLLLTIRESLFDRSHSIGEDFVGEQLSGKICQALVDVFGHRSSLVTESDHRTRAGQGTTFVQSPSKSLLMRQVEWLVFAGSSRETQLSGSVAHSSANSGRTGATFSHDVFKR